MINLNQIRFIRPVQAYLPSIPSVLFRIESHSPPNLVYLDHLSSPYAVWMVVASIHYGQQSLILSSLLLQSHLRSRGSSIVLGTSPHGFDVLTPFDLAVRAACQQHCSPLLSTSSIFVAWICWNRCTIWRSRSLTDLVVDQVLISCYGTYSWQSGCSLQMCRFYRGIICSQK